jgi:hypothetical protein
VNGGSGIEGKTGCEACERQYALQFGQSELDTVLLRILTCCRSGAEAIEVVLRIQWLHERSRP